MAETLRFTQYSKMRTDSWGTFLSSRCLRCLQLALGDLDRVFMLWGHVQRENLPHNLRNYFHTCSSTEELWGNVVDYSKRNEDNHEQCQYFRLGKNSVQIVCSVLTVVLL